MMSLWIFPPGLESRSLTLLLVVRYLPVEFLSSFSSPIYFQLCHQHLGSILFAVLFLHYPEISEDIFLYLIRG